MNGSLARVRFPATRDYIGNKTREKVSPMLAMMMIWLLVFYLLELAVSKIWHGQE